MGLWPRPPAGAGDAKQPASLKMKAVAKIKAIALGTVMTVGLLVVLFGILLASDCIRIEKKEPSSETLGAPTAEGLASATGQDDASSWPFQGFPLGQYASFEEAEQIAGYHIPRPSAEYPVAFGQTHLRWFPQFERPASTTQYTFPPLAPTSIGVIVSPSYFAAEGDEAMMSGRSMIVGGKSGWMLPDDTSFVFNYLCGEVDGYNVWCSAGAVKDIGWEAFEHFVSTLQ